MTQARSDRERSFDARAHRVDRWLARDSLPRRVAPALLGFLLLWLLLLALVIESAHYAAGMG